MIFLGIVISILMFSLIVIIHEWGHFKAARIFGVKVEEFGLGIPPRAKKLFTDKKGTLFSLNWLLLGGFVKLTGEVPATFRVYNEQKKIYNNEDLEKDIKDGKNIFDADGNKLSILEKEELLKALEENKASYNLMNKPAWQQSIIILAGIFMNFLLAFVIFFILFLIGVKPIGINNTIKTNLDLKLIPNVEQAFQSGLLEKKPGIMMNPIEKSEAQKAGIQKGDIVLMVNNISIQTPKHLQEIISKNIKNEIILKGYHINKSGEKEVFSKKIIVPEAGKIGISISENIQINPNFKYQYGVIGAAKHAFLETKNQVLMTFTGIGYLGQKIFAPKNETERKEAIQKVSGPIGIVDFVSNSLSAGVVFLVIIGALISINLGVFNLLPIPALDGGRFIFIMINSFLEKLFGRKIFSSYIESIIHFGFFVLLIALSILIGYNDISKIINK